MLETVCESRDAEYYNSSENYKRAVEKVLNVKKDVLQGLLTTYHYLLLTT